MNKFLIGAMALILGTTTATAQSLEDLNIQIHGYATQGFLYTTNNNIFTTTSSNGSPDWTEAVVNVSSQPNSKLRVGVQVRYELFGNYSNGITLDWAAADYKSSDKFGVRFGKIKVPSGLLNETQDIDPSYMWALLPQSIYPIASRNGQLTTYGGVVYGSFNLEDHPKLGKLEYRAWSGEDILASNDGYWLAYTESGLTLPNGVSGIATGGALHWKTPVTGLMIGASTIHKDKETAPINGYGLTGKYTLSVFNVPDFFARYEKKKLMVAAEAQRIAGQYGIQFAGPVSPLGRYDIRAYYEMATYKLTEKFTAGAYNSESYDRSDPLGPARYSKDWVASGRYDFNQFIYGKAEQHFIDGTESDYDANLNLGGLKPTTKLTVLKIGVSF